MRIVFFANTDWYLYNFRLSTALQLKAHGADVVMLSPPGEFGDRFDRHGIRWHQLSMDRASLNPLREMHTLRELVGLLRSEQPDLLHNFTVKCAVYGALAARLARVPAVVNAVAGMGYVFASDSLKARMLRPVVSTHDARDPRARPLARDPAEPGRCAGTDRCTPGPGRQDPPDPQFRRRHGALPARRRHDAGNARCACCSPRVCCAKRASASSPRLRACCARAVATSSSCSPALPIRETPVRSRSDEAQAMARSGPAHVAGPRRGHAGAAVVGGRDGPAQLLPRRRAALPDRRRRRGPGVDHHRPARLP